MGYYRGDYYRGDYYRGSIFSAIGKVVKGVGKVALGVLKATPAGQVATRVAGAAFPTSSFAPAAPPGQIPKPGFGGTISRILPGGDTGYYKRRRMNITNVKALRRAGRRVRGFLKLARRFGAMPISPKGKKLFKARRKK